MSIEYNRRASDHPDVMERVARVEGSILDIKDSLNSHISEESVVFKDIADSQRDMKDAIIRLTVLQEKQDARDVRVEQFQEKTETRIDVVEHRVGIIWWAAPTAVLLLSAAWTVLTHFGVL